MKGNKEVSWLFQIKVERKKKGKEPDHVVGSAAGMVAGVSGGIFGQGMRLSASGIHTEFHMSLCTHILFVFFFHSV